MKITDIRIHVLKSPLAEPFAFSQGWVKQRSATLIEVLTDEGISGWGESFAQGLEPPEIAATVIEKALKPLILGADPLDIEVLWHRMYNMTRDFGVNAGRNFPTLAGRIFPHPWEFWAVSPALKTGTPF